MPEELFHVLEREALVMASRSSAPRTGGTAGSSLALRWRAPPEYTLILSLIALLAIAALLFMGGEIQRLLSTVGVVI